jgi:hypothetical protein
MNAEAHTAETRGGKKEMPAIAGISEADDGNVCQ